MALIYTNTDLVEQGYLSGAVMDWQEESKENSFVLSMGLDDYGKLCAGCYVYDENSPHFGGRVQKVRVQTAQNSLTWEGMTFAGILSTKVIEPPSGAAYRVLTGSFADKINTVLTLTGFGDVFYTDAEGGSTDEWQIDRYTDALTALRKLSTQNGLVMVVSFDKVRQKLKISFTTARTVTAGDEYDGELFDFDITKDFTPVNHLICLGSGQLTARQIYHLYADRSGTISETQTLFGTDEVAAVYDYSAVESLDELKKEGRKHFQELLDNSTKLEITPPDEAIFHIGDRIAGQERISGIYVEKEVKKIIYKAQDDLPPSITYETTNTKKG